MSDWDTTTYLTKSHAKKGSANEKTQVRQAQRAGTLETRQKMFAGTNNKGNTAHHAKLDRETEELKHKVSMKSIIFGWSGLVEFMNQDILRVVHTQDISFLKSLSERVVSDIERL